MKPIPVKTFEYNKNGELIVLTNHQIIQRFFNEAKPNDLKQVQHILAMENYSIQAINNFVKSAGNMLVQNQK
jgi:hypothetical protein